MTMPSWKQIRLSYAVLALVVVLVSLNYARARWVFGLNITESLPNWAFVVDSYGWPVRGELAMFEVPANPYYDRPFVKRVVGVAGDTIENRGGRIYVAGLFIGEAKPFARDGRTLQAIESQVIPRGRIFMVGDHRDSYDSRYDEIGLIPVEHIIGRAFPIL